MADNFLQVGDVLTIPAPGDETAGDVVEVGSIVGVAQNTAATGENLSLAVTGVFRVTKIGSQAWTVGAKVYWDDANSRATTVSTDNVFMGWAVEAVGSGAGETTGKVRLSGGA